MESRLPLNSLCGWGLPWTLSCLLQSPEGWDHSCVASCLVWGLNLRPHISKGSFHQQTYIPNSSKGISALAPPLQCEDRATRNHLGLRDHVSSDSNLQDLSLVLPSLQTQQNMILYYLQIIQCVVFYYGTRNKQWHAQKAYTNRKMVPIPIPRNLCGMLFVSMCPSALCECPAGLDLTLYLGLDVVFFFTWVFMKH